MAAAIVLLVPFMVAPRASAASPGGNGLIAFGSDRASSYGRLHMMQPDGTQVTLLFDGGSFSNQPTWSPDGGQLAFAHDGGIWVVGADGTGARAVTTGPPDLGAPGSESDSGPSWSPDGSRIVFEREVDNLTQLYVVDVASGAVTQITDLDRAEEATWSSAGRIAFIEYDFDPFSGEHPYLAVINPDGTGFQRVPLDPPSGPRTPDWSPDGSRILFSGISNASVDLFTVTPDGGGLTNLSNNPDLVERDPVFSPDGSRIAFTAAEDSDRQDQDIFVMPAGGGAPTNIVVGEGVGAAGLSIIDFAPSWQPLGAGTPAPTTPPPPPPPPPTGGPATPVNFDGDPATTERLDTADPTAAGIAISQARFGGTGFAGAALAEYVVLSRNDDFPDSLTGSVLTGFGPLLFTATASLTPQTRAEIDRVLASSGTIYLLGGTGAISTAVEGELTGAGYAVVRLAGPSRVETALAVADEARRLFGGETVMLARDRGVPGNETSGWADSVSGGGLAAYTGIPILITPSASLHPAVADWLQADATSSVTLLGGEAALSSSVEAAVPGPLRVAGAERTETAARIAIDLWQVDRNSSDRWFVVINGSHPLGWAFGLAAAGLSSDNFAPVLLVGQQVSPATADLAGACGSPQVDLLLVGDASVISDGVAAELDALDGGDC